jgi:hypothetical protein
MPIVKPGLENDETTQEMTAKPSIWIEAEGVTTFTIVKETPEDDLLSNANILRAETAGSSEVQTTFLGLRKINDRAGDEQIEVVDKFCYLGSTEDEEADLDAEIEIRQHKMTVAFHMDKRKIYFRRSMHTEEGKAPLLPSQDHGNRHLRVSSVELTGKTRAGPP